MTPHIFETTNKNKKIKNAGLSQNFIQNGIIGIMKKSIVLKTIHKESKFRREHEEKKQLDVPPVSDIINSETKSIKLTDL
jgi:hypothetical protein